MNINALLNTLGTQCRTLPIVILYVTEGCNLRCVTCSYRHPRPDELSFEDIVRLSRALKDFGLRHIVYSGGEPLLRRDLPAICREFSSLGVRQTLLTNGVLLEKRSAEILPFLQEIIVSIDGPDEGIHDGIRGGKAFHQIIEGIRSVRGIPNRPAISIRTVVQKQNYRSIIDMVRFARNIGTDRISFLAADVLTDSFGRDRPGSTVMRDVIALDREEVVELKALIDRMGSDLREEFASGFIAEPVAKLRFIARYYEALLGDCDYPPNVCNAPGVSAVITSNGDLLPCFFLPSYANLRDGSLPDLLNLGRIRETRRKVQNGDIDRCRTCVCTLHVSPAAALRDHF